MYAKHTNAIVTRLAAATLTALLPGCATVSAAGTPPAFEGNWHVPWCHASRSDLECGGFSVTLIERAGRICGTYAGARVGLSQVDDGRPDAIKGVRVGNTAVMTLKSARSGDIYLVRAELRGERLAWKVVADVHDADGDIDVISMSDTLERRSGGGAGARSEVVEACAG